MLNLLRRWYQRHFSQPGTIEFALVLLGAFITVYYFMWLVGPLVVALCLAFCLDWPVVALSRTCKMGRHLASIVVMILFCSLVVFTMVLIVPNVIKQGAEFYNSIVAFSLDNGKNTTTTPPAATPSAASTHGSASQATHPTPTTSSTATPTPTATLQPMPRSLAAPTAQYQRIMLPPYETTPAPTSNAGATLTATPPTATTASPATTAAISTATATATTAPHVATATTSTRATLSAAPVAAAPMVAASTAPATIASASASEENVPVATLKSEDIAVAAGDEQAFMDEEYLQVLTQQSLQRPELLADPHNVNHAVVTPALRLSNLTLNPSGGDGTFTLTVTDFDLRIAQEVYDFVVNLPEPIPSMVTMPMLEQYVRNARIAATNQIASLMRTQLMPSVVNAFTWLVYLIIVPIFTFLMLYNKKSLQHNAATFLLPNNQVLMKEFWPSLHSQIAGYIRGKIIHIIVISIANTLAFMLLGVNYAMLLGVGVGLSVVIPYVGAVIIAVPVVLVAIFQFGFSTGLLWVLVIYTIIQLLDSNVLTPMLFSKAMNLDAFSILAAILIFGNLWGFWGVFFAIPLATFIKTLIVRWPNSETTPQLPRRRIGRNKAPVTTNTSPDASNESHHEPSTRI